MYSSNNDSSITAYSAKHFKIKLKSGLFIHYTAIMFVGSKLCGLYFRVKFIKFSTFYSYDPCIICKWYAIAGTFETLALLYVHPPQSRNSRQFSRFSPFCQYWITGHLDLTFQSSKVRPVANSSNHLTLSGDKVHHSLIWRSQLLRCMFKCTALHISFSHSRCGLLPVRCCGDDDWWWQFCK